MRHLYLAIISCQVLLLSGAHEVQAGMMQYKISVQVTAAPKPNGQAVTWTFGILPTTFIGTFEADDTVAGPISNLALTIGGIDIGATHLSSFASTSNTFDPASLLLDWGGYNSSFFSFIGFGDNTDPGIFPGASPPPNYVVALEPLMDQALDPFYGFNQNWVGTYSITPVPEPSSFALLGMGVMGLCGYRLRRQRETAA